MVSTTRRERVVKAAALFILLSLLGMVLSLAVRAPVAMAEQREIDTAGWESLAQCESQGDWSIDTGNGYSGGLQFAPSTWKAHGGEEFAETAGEATKEEQIYVANKLAQESGGFSPWPACNRELGLDEKYKPIEGDIPAPGSSGDSGSTDESTSPEEEDDDSSSGGTTLPEGDDSGSRVSDDGGDDALGGNSADSSGGSDSDDGSGAEATGGGESASSDETSVIVDPYGAAGEHQDPTADNTSASYGSPAQYAVNARHITDLGTASKYLVFERFSGSTGFPPGDTDTGFSDGSSIFRSGMSQIASLMFMFSMLASVLLGKALILTLNTDIIGNGLYAADLVFARLANQVSGEDSSLTSFLMWVFFAVIAFTVFQLFSLKRFSPRAMVMPFFGVVFAISAVTILGTQAAKNHASVTAVDGSTDLSEVGIESAQQGESSGHIAGELVNGTGGNVTFRDPKAWAPMSPGWMVAWVDHIAKSLGGVVSGVAGELFNTITYTIDPSSNKYTECDLYVAGMHAVFMNTPAAKGSDLLPDNASPGSLMVSYDKMIFNSVYRLWTEAAFGNTEGAGGAWCRAAEVQAKSPAADQAMISRVAGLYSEVVGTGGLGMVDDNTGSVVWIHATNPARNGQEFAPSSGTLVAANGNWNIDGKIGDEGGYVPANAAKNYFGPIYRNAAGASQAKFYFAGCDFTDQGKPAQLRAEWENATRAVDGRPLTAADCSGTITNGESVQGGFGQHMTSEDQESSVTATSWNYSVHRDDNDAYQDELIAAGEDDGALKGAAKWVVNRIGDITGLTDATAGVRGVGGTSIDSRNGLLSKFDNAEQPGTNTDSRGNLIRAGNAPRQFWETTNGFSSGTSMVYGALSVVIMFYIAKYFVALLFGALIGQVLSLVFIMIGVVLILLAFVPKLFRMLKTVLLTIGATLIVVSFIQIMMDVIFNFSVFLETLVSVPMLQQDGILRAIVSGGSVILATNLVVSAASYLTALDMRSMRGAVEAGVAMGSPVLRDMGARVTSPFDREFWGRANDENVRTIRENARNNLRGDAQDSILEGTRRRRNATMDKAQRSKAERKLPVGKMAKTAAEAALTKNPKSAAVLAGAKGAAAAGRKAKGVAKAGKAGVKSTGKNVAGALDALDRKNASNKTPLATMVRKGQPSKLRKWNGTGPGQSSGASLVPKKVKDSLKNHPLRSMDEGDLSTMAVSALGLEPRLTEGSLKNSRSMNLSEATLADAMAGTPGLLPTDVSDRSFGDSAAAQLDYARSARQMAADANPIYTAQPGQSYTPEQELALIDQASRVGGMAGADRPTFLGDDYEQSDSGLFVPASAATKMDEVAPPGGGRADRFFDQSNKVFDTALQNLNQGRLADRIAQQVPGVSPTQLLDAAKRGVDIADVNSWKSAPGELGKDLATAAEKFKRSNEARVAAGQAAQKIELPDNDAPMGVSGLASGASTLIGSAHSRNKENVVKQVSEDHAKNMKAAEERAANVKKNFDNVVSLAQKFKSVHGTLKGGS